MKIDIEQFLAMTVALGCAGAVTFAVYSDRSDMSDVIAGIEAAEEPTSAEPTVAEEIVATVVAPGPMPAAPVDLDDASGIPAIIPDDDSSYAPGPTSESDQWQ